MTREERYHKILEETARETNRVLANWYMTDMPVTFDNMHSLFKSYFSKYCRHYFDYNFYRTLCRIDKPKPIIVHNMLIGVDIAFPEYGAIGFEEALKSFDFTAGNLFPETTFRVTDVISKATPSNLIDYKRIEQFTY